MFIKLPSVDKGGGYETGQWFEGESCLVDPFEIIAVKPKEHRYHAMEAVQKYYILFLRGGSVLEVFSSITVVEARLDAVYRLPAKFETIPKQHDV